MDSDPNHRSAEEEMDDEHDCTESEVDQLLGPRSASGLSDSMGAVSLEVGLCVCFWYIVPPPTAQIDFEIQYVGLKMFW